MTPPPDAHPAETAGMRASTDTEPAYRTMLVYMQRKGYEESDISTAIRDLMADLLHLADEYGEDAEHEHAWAWRHYAAEKHDAG